MRAAAANPIHKQMEFFKKLFTADFMPHGHCYYWEPKVLWLNVLSDGTIAVAYFAIPLALTYLVQKRQKLKQDLRFGWIFYMFGAFILLCGTTHIIDIITVWKPYYRLEGVVKAVTAIVSLGTALALLPLIPLAIALPSRKELEDKNAELQAEIERRNEAETALKESQARFSAIFNQTFQMIGFLSPDGTLLEVNETALEFGGVQRQDVVGKPFWDCPWWQVSAAAQKQLRAAVVQAAGGEFVRYEADVRGSGDTRAVIDFSLKPLKDPQGKVVYLIPEGRDVTELRRAEAESQRQREILRTVLENLAEGVVACDAADRLMMCNKTAREWHGADILKVPPTEWVNCFDLYEGDGKTPLAAESLPLVRASRGEKVRDAEMAIAVKGQAPRFLLASGDALYTESEAKLGAVVVMHDITERKQRAEELEQLVTERTQELANAKAEADRANQAKSELLSRVSHELRTPLNAILGFAQLQQLAGPASQSGEGAERIIKAGRHLLDLINEVLDLARIEAGRISLSLEPVRVADLLAEVTAMMEPLVAERSIRMEVQCEPEDLHVRSDRQRLKQVLLNLVSNGVKYNRDQGRLVLRALADRERVRITVRDTGRGLSPEQVDKLFIPFERLGADQTETEGTGLGLALTRRLVEAMEGSIGVESEQDVGSTFRLDLPSAAPVNRPVREAISTDDATLEGSGALTLLYIEDNPENLRLVEAILEHRPRVRFLSAMLGRLGIELARQQRPDLILLDLNLPDLNGAKVLVDLKAHETTRDIPVYMLSADAMADSIDRTKQLGAEGYLIKPFDVPDFLQLLDRFSNDANA